MPQQASQSSNAPPLPPGYTLDAPAQSAGSVPPLPQGYTLDQQSGDKPGYFKRLGQSLGIPTSTEELKDAITPVMVGGIPTVPKQSGLGVAVNYGKNLYEKGKEFVEKPSAGSGLRAAMAITPAGQTGQTIVEDAATGNFRGAAGGATGIGLQMAAPELAERIPAGKISSSMKVVAGPAAEAASKLPVLDKVVGAARALGKYKGVPGELADIWRKPASEAPPAAEAAPRRELPAAFQPLPPKAPPVPGTVDAPFKSGQLAASMKAPAAEAAPSFQRGSLQTLLDRSLGARQLDPKVPLKNQMDVPPPKARTAAAPSADVPEGHTAHQSSAIPSSRYDAGANEFHARMVSGDTTYVYGDVSPEEAQAFTDAPSKGKAFQQIKTGHPLVAKIVNGKRIAVKPGVSQ